MRNVFPIKCHISNAADGEPTRVEVYDDIGEGGWFVEGLTAKAFSARLAGIKGPLDVHINSYGGDVADGQAITSTIRNYKGHKRTIVDGFACSAASVILQAGDERIVEPGAIVMVHDASGGCVGSAADVAAFAAVLDKISDSIAQQYADRAGGTAAEWRDVMRGETWYTADEAVEHGLADRKGTGQAALPAGLDLAAFAVPDRIAARLRSLPVAQAPDVKPAPEPEDEAAAKAHAAQVLTEAGYDPEVVLKALGLPAVAAEQSCEAQGHQCCKDAAAARVEVVITGGGDGNAFAGEFLDTLKARISAASGVPGTHGDHERWDPDGDGDCDACPEGDTDNSHWSPDGEQIESVPGKPMPPQDQALTADSIRALIREELAALRNAGGEVDNSDWDGDKAWHNGATADDPAAFYAGICAGRKAGDKATQDAWALPYKYHPGDPPNAGGVKAALGRLSQTDGLTNAEQAKATLQAAMKKVNPDWEPEDIAGIDISGIDLGQLGNQLHDVLKGALA